MKTEFEKWLGGGGIHTFAIYDNPEIMQGIESLRVQAYELGKMVCPRSTFSVDVVDNLKALRSAAFLAMSVISTPD